MRIVYGLGLIAGYVLACVLLAKIIARYSND